MGINNGDTTTPLSAIFFKTVIVGVAVGTVLSVITHLLPLGSPGLDAGKLPLVLISGASMGAVLGGGSAAGSLALHSLTKKLKRLTRALAAGVGGALGILVPPIVALGPSTLANTSSWWLPLSMIAGAVFAVVTTRPLRTEAVPAEKSVY